MESYLSRHGMPSGSGTGQSALRRGDFNVTLPSNSQKDHSLAIALRRNVARPHPVQHMSSAARSSKLGGELRQCTRHAISQAARAQNSDGHQYLGSSPSERKPIADERSSPRALSTMQVVRPCSCNPSRTAKGWLISLANPQDHAPQPHAPRRDCSQCSRNPRTPTLPAHHHLRVLCRAAKSDLQTREISKLQNFGNILLPLPTFVNMTLHGTILEIDLLPNYLLTMSEAVLEYIAERKTLAFVEPSYRKWFHQHAIPQIRQPLVESSRSYATALESTYRRFSLTLAKVSRSTPDFDQSPSDPRHDQADHAVQLATFLIYQRH
ncbi:hypothetical protein IWX90DRAFT_234241 [Phyllosticta citrichinensis]|uniref:Uncharacterized protein n=1 Tax=Phyllosticta citrichinensis TaxID=1130410 RepID=A0ABR1XV59_9PEZI